jgi:hypothetical protein
MEPSVEIYQPSRLYARVGWAALAGSLICVLCGFRAPLAFIPGFLCASTALALFWLSARPAIRIGETQFNIGERAIAWREVREINSSRFVSPLVLKLKLTNSRQKMLIYPGEPERIAKLIVSLRKNSRFATFDGVSYHDYWSWNNLSGTDDGLAGGLNKEKSSGLTNPPNSPNPPAGPPVRMLSPEDEDEVERLYQKLKTVGRLDSRSTESSKSPDED